jgi:hypothetical protein
MEGLLSSLRSHSFFIYKFIQYMSERVAYQNGNLGSEKTLVQVGKFNKKRWCDLVDQIGEIK